MPKLIDLTGLRFGRLVVGKHAETNGRRHKWECRCDCGIDTIVAGNNLKSGNTSSCGCIRSEKSRARRLTHGKRHAPEYITWASMRSRCSKPSNKSFPRYGGRGIRVCKRWARFENFIADMGERPSPSYTLDRRNNNSDYKPSNCRWATKQEQANNRRSNRLVRYRNLTVTLREALDMAGNIVSFNTAKARAFDYGWDIAAAVETPRTLGKV